MSRGCGQMEAQASGRSLGRQLRDFVYLADCVAVADYLARLWAEGFQGGAEPVRRGAESSRGDRQPDRIAPIIALAWGEP